jgi:1-acyl-sn-glycerol-3-phosphate acyltransferase
VFKLLGKLYFKLAGWKIVGSFDEAPPKYIAIVMPHTANFDFILGVLARAQLDIKNAKYLGKSQLFNPPFGFIFRWLGGYPGLPRNMIKTCL